MLEGGEFQHELTVGVCGIKGTVYSLEQTEEASIFYLYTGFMDVTSKITDETIVLEPGEFATIRDDGQIVVDTFNITSKAKEMAIPMEILIDDGYDPSDEDLTGLVQEDREKDTNPLIFIIPLAILLLAIGVVGFILVQKRNPKKNDRYSSEEPHILSTTRYSSRNSKKFRKED